MYGGSMGYGVMGIEDGQHSWIRSIQNFTSSLTYLTEVRKNNCNFSMEYNMHIYTLILYALEERRLV